MKRELTRIENKKIIYFKSIASTQEYAKKIAGKSSSGTVVVAEKQTKGRGRFEREWYSQRGGLFFSVILKPQVEPRKIPVLTYKMALAVMDTIRKVLAQYPGQNKVYTAALKWPNDVVMVKRSRRFGRDPDFPSGNEGRETKYKKIGGILTESSINKNKVDWVIVGVGININNKIPVSLKNTAVSLRKITFDNNISLTGVFNTIMANFEKYYTDFPDTKTLAEYKKNSIFFRAGAEKIAIDFGGNEYTGRASGITDDGGLEIMLSGGIKKIFYAGDVVLY